MSKSQEFIDKFNSPEYGVWFSMIKRCHDHKHKAYKNYGGRGIIVCERWLGDNGFNNFYTDMCPRPADNLSIDRIDNNGNYCPENCRWATRTQQARNRRTNRLICIDSETKSVAEWAEISGIPQRTIRDRLDNGWEEKQSVFELVREESKISIGEKYGKWTVININCSRASNGALRAKCKCDCGKENIIVVNDLKMGKSTQCKSCAGIENFSTRKVITITYDGTTNSLMKWSRIIGVHNTTLRNRIKWGWDVKEILFGRTKK
jgi:hypothetical protein